MLSFHFIIIIKFITISLTLKVMQCYVLISWLWHHFVNHSFWLCQYQNDKSQSLQNENEGWVVRVKDGRERPKFSRLETKTTLETKNVWSSWTGGLHFQVKSTKDVKDLSWTRAVFIDQCAWSWFPEVFVLRLHCTWFHRYVQCLVFISHDLDLHFVVTQSLSLSVSISM